jgi:hypothetical protein
MIKNTIAVAAQNIKRLVCFLSQAPKPMLATRSAQARRNITVP